MMLDHIKTSDFLVIIQKQYLYCLGLGFYLINLKNTFAFIYKNWSQSFGQICIIYCTNTSKQ